METRPGAVKGRRTDKHKRTATRIFIPLSDRGQTDGRQAGRQADLQSAPGVIAYVDLFSQ